jgi:methylenetetrahydrofolate reductase (NADPH)
MDQQAPAEAAADKSAPAGARLRAVVEAGHFAATVETTPPLTGSAEAVLVRVAPLRGWADAINVTDGAGARVHVSALAAAAILVRAGIEPVLQFTVRDRNLLALQADLLGAAALGVPNMLALRGDDVAAGDSPDATMVEDVDSEGLIKLIRAMRDDGSLPSGRAIDSPPRLWIGAADAPFDPAPDWKPDRAAAKIAAGAQFFQTQFCFEPDVLGRYMARLGDAGLLERTKFIIGLGPLASARSARWMTENLWGVTVPEAVIARLDGAADPQEEGIDICVEMIAAIRGLPGVAGVHLMGPRTEARSAEVIRRAGILDDRPAALRPPASAA